jgi:hypothetical protein
VDTTRLRLRPGVVARVLTATAVFVVLLSTVFQVIKYVFHHDEVMGLVSLTFVDNERNIPTLFSVLDLALASLCLAVVAALTRKNGRPDFSKWVVLSVGFLYLAFDEALSLHERMSAPIKSFFGGRDVGFHHTYWAIPGLAGVIVLGLYFLKFLFRLPARTRILFVLAGAIFVGGAVGVEMLSGDYYEVHGYGLGYSMIATIEESLEMAGVILFIYAILDYLAREYGGVLFDLRTGAPVAADPPAFAKSPGIAYKAQLPGA